MNLFLKKTALLSAAISLAGCATISVLPAPERASAPEAKLSTPEQFFNAEGSTLPLSLQWWSLFNDPELTELIDQTLAANRQLDVAEANIKIASANLARQTLETSYSTDSSVNLDIDRNAAFNQNINTSLRGTLGASWEYDAFGRIASAIKAAELNVKAAEEARQDIAVIVSSETALAYIDLRGAQKRLSVARENAQTQSTSLDLLKELFDNGRATELDVSRAESQYRTTLADLPRFQAIIDNAISRLAALTGTSATNPNPALLSVTTTQRDIPALQAPFNIGSPAELIRRRPDIRAAETDIARLLALSDVERARLFPALVFNGNILTLLSAGNGIGQLSGIGFGLGPAIRWEGPDLRRVRADIDFADAQTERAYKIYEQTVTQALSDVEIALASRNNELRRQQDLSLAAQAAQTALEIATLRFEEGLDDFLDVLDAQRTLLTAQDRLAENQLQATRLTVLAYRELGGI